jgi:hypothetical protein
VSRAIAQWKLDGRTLAALNVPLCAPLQAAYDQAVLAICLEVGQQLGDRLPDDSPPVDPDAMLGTQDQSCVLQAEQLL